MPKRMAVSVNMIWIGWSMIPSARRAVLMTPSLRMTCIIAIVRMRRLVQKGMVMRKSHISRRSGRRVAMK